MKSFSEHVPLSKCTSFNFSFKLISTPNSQPNNLFVFIREKKRVWLCSGLCGWVILVTHWLDITYLQDWLGTILWVWLSSISNIFARIHFHDPVEIILINMMHHKHFLVSLLTRETCCAALPYTFKLAARPHHSFSVNSAKWPKSQAVGAVVEWDVVLLHCEVLLKSFWS